MINVKESCKLCDHMEGREQWCFMHKVVPAKRCFHHTNPVAVLKQSCEEDPKLKELIISLLKRLFNHEES